MLSKVIFVGGVLALGFFLGTRWPTGRLGTSQDIKLSASRRRRHPYYLDVCLN